MKNTKFTIFGNEYSVLIDHFINVIRNGKDFELLKLYKNRHGYYIYKFKIRPKHPITTVKHLIYQLQYEYAVMESTIYDIAFSLPPRRIKFIHKIIRADDTIVLEQIDNSLCLVFGKNETLHELEIDKKNEYKCHDHDFVLGISPNIIPKHVTKDVLEVGIKLSANKMYIYDGMQKTIIDISYNESKKRLDLRNDIPRNMIVVESLELPQSLRDILCFYDTMDFSIQCIPSSSHLTDDYIRLIIETTTHEFKTNQQFDHPFIFRSNTLYWNEFLKLHRYKVEPVTLNVEVNGSSKFEVLSSELHRQVIEGCDCEFK